ncbi:protein-L-isoaspartate O-methyltransferase family protein [Acidisoma cladoniae]|jgi:protein-L-isoaspartate(D-aspartate) O-methyltransferase|uniref:protein-L-isoaspartate O-methyltransferase family protein n=1 Tax=Acidisoma cladoniae TaxID=3040935 RepID=UPI00254D296A|nr:protein-L-isoaspartate O-methyltransferase [Acidisoma sp. PAMC 29798]
MDARSHVREAIVVIDNSARLPRRGFLSAASLAAAAIGLSAPSLAAFAADAPPPVTTETMGKPWTRERYNQAMAESGRPTVISQAEFDTIQARKPAAMKMIASYLSSHFGKVDPLVMAAFEQVPREYYHYMYQNRVAAPAEAYESTPKPWAIGYGSALSDYLGQAYMTQLLEPKPGMVSLEVGTGSGFQSSLLSRIVSKAYSIEIIEPLGHAVSHIFKPLGYDNIETKVGDGYYGWPEVSEGFDVIIVTCAAEYAPPDLFKQLKSGGRMIIPIGQPFKRGQVLYVYTKDENGKIHSRRDVGVFFIPMTGAIQKTPKAT